MGIIGPGGISLADSLYIDFRENHAAGPKIGSIEYREGSSADDDAIAFGFRSDDGSGMLRYIYFTADGQVLASRFRGVADSATSAGYADTASHASGSDRLEYTGTGSGCFTTYQTSEAFYGGEGWASYLICNHGDGSSYYHQMMRFPFWGEPQYQRMEGGVLTGWRTFITSNNIGSQSVNYATSAGTAGHAGITVDTLLSEREVNEYTAYSMTNWTGYRWITIRFRFYESNWGWMSNWVTLPRSVIAQHVDDTITLDVPSENNNYYALMRFYFKSATVLETKTVTKTAYRKNPRLTVYGIY